MNEPWIKWTKGLTRKREVLLVAERLRIPPPQAAALCMQVWEWADDNTTDGYLRGMTPRMISAAVGIPGIAEALAAPEIGWLHTIPDGVVIPNFDRHNGKTAKQRALSARRSEAYRTRKEGP